MNEQTADRSLQLRDGDTVEQVVEPRQNTVDGLGVRRLLPTRQRRSVGPFVFFDHMGPAELAPGEGIQVRPHPHIGLATVTYLFDGEIIHRDSLGSVQAIRAGAVNLMTAGRGIVHSERAGSDLDEHSRLHGIQTWMALPADLQECAPEFLHYPAEHLPEIDSGGVSIRVIIGAAYGGESPVIAASPTLYLECRMPAGARLALPDDQQEIAAYVVAGDIRVDGRSAGAGRLVVARAGNSLLLEADSDSHVMAIGGRNLGERHIWWNFVSTSKARIEQAGRDWREGRFPLVPGDDEFIPLPE